VRHETGACDLGLSGERRNRGRNELHECAPSLLITCCVVRGERTTKFHVTDQWHAPCRAVTDVWPYRAEPGLSTAAATCHLPPATWGIGGSRLRDTRVIRPVVTGGS